MLDFKPRVEDRTKVMIRARLRGAGAERDACIVDISSRGLSATADNAPPRGGFVELVVGDHVLVGQVKWSGMRRFGIALRQRISVVSLLAGDGEPIALAARDKADRQVGRRNGRAAGASVRGRRIEAAIFFAAGAAATFVVADYVGAALGSLNTAKIAMQSGEGR